MNPSDRLPISVKSQPRYDWGKGLSLVLIHLMFHLKTLRYPQYQVDTWLLHWMPRPSDGGQCGSRKWGKLHEVPVCWQAQLKGPKQPREARTHTWLLPIALPSCILPKSQTDPSSLAYLTGTSPA